MSLHDSLSDMLAEDKYAHGGNVRKLAEKAGCAPSELLDFSASINPLGPPDWIRSEISAGMCSITRYPDPDSSEVTLAACELYQVWPTECVAGNGASELLMAAVRMLGGKRAVIPAPAYVDYARVCELGKMQVDTVSMDPEDGFRFPYDDLAAKLSTPSLVFLTSPGNPTGRPLNAARIREIAKTHPDSHFIVDESFGDFMPRSDRILGQGRPKNVITLVSMTKFYAIPGLRLGLAFASPELALKLKSMLSAWSVNSLAQRVGARCLKDAEYRKRSREKTVELREALAEGLRSVPGLMVYPSKANFLLCRVTRVGGTAREIHEGLLEQRIAVRLCDNFCGLDHTFFRVAVRTREENERLIRAVKRIAGMRVEPRVKKKPSIMVQGSCSNAGKSVLAAALCRIFLQDGLEPAPFKAQNMSLNSFVTRDGGEMGRAQAVQAAACRLEPDVRMNPVLLKPGSDTGSQVIVMGKPVGNMRVHQYVEYKPKAFEAVRAAYDSLAETAGVLVLEGAGSPAEINLKHHDIVNMAMAEYAEAGVLLAGDIDRGGVFAALVGTMELLSDRERDMVAGFVLNKFRGDASLLDPALDFMLRATGRPVLGVVPHLPDLGLPEEDSVSFKASDGRAAEPRSKEFVDLALIDLPRISNFTDMDAFSVEPDVRVRVVRNADGLGTPDAVIIPGSKNTIADLAHLRRTGLADLIPALPPSTRIVGICGGLQIIGLYISDPYDVEFGGDPTEGLNLLPIQTFMDTAKTLVRTTALHRASGLEVKGYEIHHGQTEALLETALPDFQTPDGRTTGFSMQDGRAWGTYLHGVFDNDEFRRWFIDDLRKAKGLAPLGAVQGHYDIDAALDRLADAVRESLDMRAVYRIMGL